MASDIYILKALDANWKKCPSLKGYIFVPIPTSRTWQSFLRTFTNTRHDHLKHFTNLIEIKWHLIAISSCMFFPGQTRLPNPGELGMMVQARVTEKRKTYGKGCPRESKAQKKRATVVFLDIQKVPDWYTLQAALVIYHILFVSHGLLSSHFHPDLRSWVLHRCADLCLKSSLVNRNLKVAKSKWAVLLPKGFQLFSSIIGHLLNAFWLAWRETGVRLAGLIQVSHHGLKEIPEQREWEAGLAHTAQIEEKVQTGGFPTVVHFFLNLNSSLARELYALGTFQNSAQSLLVLKKKSPNHIKFAK